MKLRINNKILGLFLIFCTLSIQLLYIDMPSGFNNNLLLSILGEGDDGIDDDLIEWLRIPEIKSNSNLEEALTSPSPLDCLAIFDSGLDQETWTHLQTRFGINFRLFKHAGSTYTEIFYGEDLDIGGHHGSMMCSLIASLLEDYISQILVFQVLDEERHPNNEHIYDALEYIETLWSQGFKVKVVNMSIRTISDDSDVESKLQELSSYPYRITFFAGSGNTRFDDDENEQVFPADYHPVLGVGGILFKDSSFEGFRMRRATTAFYASMFWTRITARASTPVVVAPGEKVEVACNKDGEGEIDAYIVSGTSASSAIMSAVGYMIFKIQKYRYPGSYVSSSRIYEIICFNSEGDNVDSTRKPAVGNSIIYEPTIGWGGVDFYDYLLYAYEMFTPPPPPPPGGGGGGGPRPI